MYVTDEILRMEAEEGLEKIQEALKVCSHYVKTYHAYKTKLPQYFKEKPVLKWEFQSSMIFSLFDRFVNQLKIVEVIN